LDNQGRLQTTAPDAMTLHLDPHNGALLQPEGTLHTLVLLELFPRVGPVTPLLGAPLGEDGQPLRNIRMDHQGVFTDLLGMPVARDPLTSLPLDSTGQAVRPARLAVPGGGAADARFAFALPVQTDRVTFQFVTRLHLFIRPELQLATDLRQVLTLKHRLAQHHDYLLSLNETNNKQPHVFALVYETNALTGSELQQADVRRLGSRMGVLIHFFAES
jgi:hypothetical protein